MKLIDQRVWEGMHLKSIQKNVYGIEVELENWQGGKLPENINRVFVLDDDPSLRGGVEFVSEPLTQTALKASLRTLDEVIKAQDLKTSQRCSIHIHMNTLNMTWGQLWSLMALNTYLEPEMFNHFAPERDLNHFCVPTYLNTYLQQLLSNDIFSLKKLEPVDICIDLSNTPEPSLHDYITATADTPTPEWQPPPQASYEGGPKRPASIQLLKYIQSIGVSSLKYGAMTLYRMADLGTVEFRILPGSTNMQDAIDWLRFLGKLKFHAMKYKDPLDLQHWIESITKKHMWEKVLSVGPIPSTTKFQRQESRAAAFKIIGSEPMQNESTEWSIS